MAIKLRLRAQFVVPISFRRRPPFARIILTRMSRVIIWMSPATLVAHSRNVSRMSLVIADWTRSPWGAPPGLTRFFLNGDDITARIAARETVVQLRVLEGAEIRVVAS